jgi:hypothetical protein
MTSLLFYIYFIYIFFFSSCTWIKSYAVNWKESTLQYWCLPRDWTTGRKATNAPALWRTWKKEHWTSSTQLFETWVLSLHWQGLTSTLDSFLWFWSRLSLQLIFLMVYVDTVDGLNHWPKGDKCSRSLKDLKKRALS